MSESLFNKIRIMKPDDAFDWVKNNQDKIGELDERTKAMLYRKLEKVDDTPEPEKEPEQNLVSDETPEPETQLDPTPKIERFICNRFPKKWILVGNKEIRFQGGEFRTSDPELIEAIVNDPHFGLWILADNPDLMKRRKRFK